MKVETNITLFAGAEPDYGHLSKAEEKAEKENQSQKTIFAGDLNINQTLQERIQQRKEKAQQEALKIIRDAWGKDQALDQSMDESREHIRQMEEENLQLRTELNKIEEERQQLKETYGVTDDTPLEEMPEDYRTRMSELNDYAKYNQEVLGKNQGDIAAENATIRGIKSERLKKHTMVDAQKQADEALEAAADEIIGMVVDQAKEHLDEEQEKREEQAEKIEEKKEEMEELQEKREERKEELEELIENIPVQEVLEMDQEKTNIQQEVQLIVDKMKLIAEDIKGSIVDSNI